MTRIREEEEAASFETVADYEFITHVISAPWFRHKPTLTDQKLIIFFA